MIFSTIILGFALAFSQETATPSNPPMSVEKEGPEGVPFFLQLTPADTVSLYSTGQPGFRFKKGNSVLHFGGECIVDGFLFTMHSNENDRFLLNDAKLGADLTWNDQFMAQVVGKFTSFSASFDAAYIQTMVPKYARLRVGYYKPPFSLLALRSLFLSDFYARSLAVINFVDFNDTGIMIFGSSPNKIVDFYGIGVFNGTATNISPTSTKEIIGRISLSPFHNQQTIFSNIYLGISGATYAQRDRITGRSFITGSGTIFWKWSDSPGVTMLALGHRNRWGVDFEWYLGSFCLRSEYLSIDWTKVEMKTPTSKIRSSFHSDDLVVEAAYVLTGEKKVHSELVSPLHPVDFHGHYGAWELALRYEFLNMNLGPLNKGMAVGTPRVHGFILGLNNYLTENIAFKLNWERFFFKKHVLVGDSSLPGESVVVGRLQAFF